MTTDNTNDINNNVESLQVPSTTDESKPEAKEKRRYPWLAVLSLLLCIAAWVVASRNGVATLIIGIASILAGAFALGSHRGAVRNTAITSIIATAVLVLVVGAFMIALHKLLV